MKANIITASILSGLIFFQGCASTKPVTPQPEFAKAQEMKPGDIVDWHHYEAYERNNDRPVVDGQIRISDPVEPSDLPEWWWSKNGKVDAVGEVLVVVALVAVLAAAVHHTGKFNKDWLNFKSGSPSKRDPSVRRAFHKSNPCPSTGKTSGACPGYHVDHIVPISCGGSDSTSNMQWLTASANLSKGGCR